VNLLLDTNIVVPVTRREIASLGDEIVRVLDDTANQLFVSVASIWEIAIKTRLKKLDPRLRLSDLPSFVTNARMTLLRIDEMHAVEELTDPPATRDPFDRMLLAQCQVEGLRLVTLDRVLAAHPLAWRQ